METMFKRKHTGITLKYPNRSFLQTKKYPSTFYSLFTKSPLEGDSRPARKKLPICISVTTRLMTCTIFSIYLKKREVTESARGNYVFI